MPLQCPQTSPGILYNFGHALASLIQTDNVEVSTSYIVRYLSACKNSKYPIP